MTKNKIREVIEEQLEIFYWPVSLTKGNHHRRLIQEQFRKQLDIDFLHDIRSAMPVFSRATEIITPIIGRIKELHD